MRTPIRLSALVPCILCGEQIPSRVEHFGRLPEIPPLPGPPTIDFTVDAKPMLAHIMDVHPA
jgi:hypothetical protein